MWKYIYEDFSELSKSEQMALFNTIKQDLFQDEHDKIAKLLKNICEARFASGLGCVHCVSTSVKRNGKYRSRQRYLCNDCGKSFNELQYSSNDEKCIAL
mgnify:CR=1 FL=1